MHPLIATLASWPGRQSTKRLLAAKGYTLLEHYKEIVLANCGGCDESTLECYWDEVAREYICSAGRVHSTRREFAGETSYRSEYLDNLAALPTNRDAASKGGPLIEGLKIFAQKRLENDLWRRIDEHCEILKKAEAENFGIVTDGWTGTKDDFGHFLRPIAETRGYALRKKKWRKNLGDLELSWSVDRGKRTTWQFQLPLVLEIVHKSAPDLIFLAKPGSVMPGFRYVMYKSPASAILGIQAVVDLFDTIGDQITKRV